MCKRAPGQSPWQSFHSGLCEGRFEVPSSWSYKLPNFDHPNLDQDSQFLHLLFLLLCITANFSDSGCLEKFASAMAPAIGILVARERRYPTGTARRRPLCKSARNVVLCVHTGLTVVGMIDISVRRKSRHLQLSLISKSKHLLSSASPFDSFTVVLHPQKTTTLPYPMKRLILIALLAPLGILPHTDQHSPGVSISQVNSDYFLKIGKMPANTRPFPSSCICSPVSQYHKSSRGNRHRE